VTPGTWRIAVISPHFDDGVLSVAGLVLRRAEPAAVVTVLGGAPEDDVPASVWDRTCGFRTAAEAAHHRAAEDARACRLLDVESVPLPGLDGSYPGAGGGHVPSEHLTELLAGLAPDALVLVPAGIGGHPDHLRVRDAALRILAARPDQPVGIYADLPYAAALWHWGTDRSAAALTGLPALHALAGPVPEAVEATAEHVRLDDAEWAAKRDALWAYASQLAPLGAYAMRLMADPGPLRHEVVWWVRSRRAT
jgi:LmbE family N-acetylglucosaminyl deacetylase